ncbi:MAG TPA: AAA family ATPase [Candidatus Solibacter sp.]|jgi:predicted AAA+ superfamily ATPase|nr:AAA family ATPase [Candidatus Solibacter sp.]
MACHNCKDDPQAPRTRYQKNGLAISPRSFCWTSAVRLDLESSLDREKLADAAFYLSAHEDQVVVLDEVQRLPELFSTLRGLIDQGRRRGKTAGRFLLLGSASVDLLRQSEKLAGRVAYIELSPFDVLETPADRRDRLWVRGGFPESFLAVDDARSYASAAPLGCRSTARLSVYFTAAWATPA